MHDPGAAGRCAGLLAVLALMMVETALLRPHSSYKIHRDALWHHGRSMKVLEADPEKASRAQSALRLFCLSPR